MSKQSISIVNSSGMRAATPGSMPLSQGDTLTFSTDDDAAALLCFAPQTSGILEPSPGASVSIEGGSSVSFTVGPVANGTYCSIVLPAGSIPPNSVDCKAAENPGATFVIKTGLTEVFSAPNWQTGR